MPRRSPEKFEPKKGETLKLEDDPQYKQILEKKSLDYLKTKDAKWFYSEYSGEVAPSGYLMDKNGKETNFLPSQCVGSMTLEKEIKPAALDEFTQEYPDDAKKHEKRDIVEPIEEKTEEELGEARGEAEEAFEEGEKE